jgi:hypothetical protein
LIDEERDSKQLRKGVKKTCLGESMNLIISTLDHSSRETNIYLVLQTSSPKTLKPKDSPFSKRKSLIAVVTAFDPEV